MRGLYTGPQADEPRRLERLGSKDRSGDWCRGLRENRRRRSTNRPSRRVLPVCALAELSLGATGAVEGQRRRLGKLRIIGPIRSPTSPTSPAEPARAIAVRATGDVRPLVSWPFLFADPSCIPDQRCAPLAAVSTGCFSRSPNEGQHGCCGRPSTQPCSERRGSPGNRAARRPMGDSVSGPPSFLMVGDGTLSRLVGKPSSWVLPLPRGGLHP